MQKCPAPKSGRSAEVVLRSGASITVIFFENQINIHKGENSWDIRSRNLPEISCLATFVEQKHRFVIFDFDRTRDFISRPLWKNITDPMLFEHKSRDFEASSHAPWLRDTRQPGSKVKVGGRRLNSRVSGSMLKKHRFRDFEAPWHHWFKITDNKKRNHARGNIISCVSSRF